MAMGLAAAVAVSAAPASRQGGVGPRLS